MGPAQTAFGLALPEVAQSLAVPVHDVATWPRSTRRPERGEAMKPDIHPTYVPTQVTCTCGSTFVTRSTAENGSIHAETCSQCHPFYTGKQRILDTGGRVARFEKRYGKK
jgi:large subunit ribosomal protein L31